jgi:hypothetical protein
VIATSNARNRRRCRSTNPTTFASTHK